MASTPATKETYADPPPNAPDFLSHQKLWGSAHAAPPGSRRAGTDPMHAGRGTPSSPTGLQKLSAEQVADALSPSSPDPHSHFISCLHYETVTKTLKYLGLKEGSKIPSWPSNLFGGALIKGTRLPLLSNSCRDFFFNRIRCLYPALFFG